MLDARNSLSQAQVTENSKAIFRNIKNTKILDFSTFLVYSNFKNEVYTDELIEFLCDNNREVYLPKCDTTTKTFAPVLYSRDTTLNKYGIKEPTHSEFRNVTIDCAVVPGVAFDVKGNRIGFGAGYYDKFFQDNPSVFKIGLCHEIQLCEEIRADKFDVPMDIIITEKQIILC